MSHTKAAWPSEARMVEACGAGRIKIASFRDTAGVILRPKNSASFAGDTAPIPQKPRSNLQQNTHKLLMDGVFPRESRIRFVAKLNKFVNNPQTMLHGHRERTRTDRHRSCDDGEAMGRYVPKCDSSTGFRLRCRVPIDQDRRWMRACWPTPSRPALRWCRWSRRQNGRRFPAPSCRCPTRHLWRI